METYDVFFAIETPPELLTGAKHSEDDVRGRQIRNVLAMSDFRRRITAARLGTRRAIRSSYGAKRDRKDKGRQSSAHGCRISAS